MPTIVWILLILAAALIGGYAGYLYRKNVAEKKIGRTEEYAKKLLDDATRKAEDNKKEMILAAKEEILHLKSELDKESSVRRTEMQRSERRIEQREETLDKREAQLDKRKESLAARDENLEKKYADVQISGRAGCDTRYPRSLRQISRRVQFFVIFRGLAYV